MARRSLIALLAAVAAALCAPLGAQARTPCAAEQAAPTANNSAAVSDAVFCLTNQIRAHYRLPALRRETRLDAAAALHSLDMAARNFFAHTNPDGLAPGARAAAQGYSTGVGENIGHGYANARAVVLAWMQSAGHCRNILGAAADLGVGTAGSGVPHYTQVFGDYFSRPVDDAPRSGCPYTVDLDAIDAPDDAAPPLVGDPALSRQVAPARPHAAAPAVTRLSLRALSLSPRRFRAGRRGTTISYALSAPATVTLRLRRAGGSRGRYLTTAARITRRGVAGANRLRLTGRLGGRLLRPGRYRLHVVATDGAGARTRVAHSGFVIVAR